MRIFLAQEFHDITGPVDYFLLKPWMIKNLQKLDKRSFDAGTLGLRKH